MTIIPSIEIKWGKETLTLKDYDISTGIKGLKHEVHVMTNIPLDRLKLMSKTKPGLWKGILKDDSMNQDEYNNMMEDFMKKYYKNCIQLLLMGSAADVTIEPKQKTVFIEDLPPEEIAKVLEPSGLVNLGNTCYLNSVIQCLRTIKPLRNILNKYTPSLSSSSNNTNATTMNSNPNLNTLFISSLREAYKQLDKQSDAYQPMALVHATKLVFPQFAQKGPQGQPMQQDAEEFFNNLLTILANETTITSQNNNKVYINAAFDKQRTNAINTTPNSYPIVTDEALMGASNVIDAIFGLKMKETLTCDELTSTSTTTIPTSTTEGDNNADQPMTTEDQLIEPPVISYDLTRKLVCNIQGGSDGNQSTINVNYINEGIQLSLDGKIEKHSNILGRNAIWSRQQRIVRLPPIITIQFGRFYWKSTPDSQDHSGVKCKVMKPVAFNSELDIYDFCSVDVQKILSISRHKALLIEDERIQAKLKGIDMEVDGGETATKTDNGDGAAATAAPAPADEEMDDELKEALALSLAETADNNNNNEISTVTPVVGPGLPFNFQGIYELFAVVTHKGRDADGGHYMAWVKADHIDDIPTPVVSDNKKKIADTDDMNEDWYVYDDDEVSPCKTEDVLKLKGGGDWHMSYLNFYRAKK